MQRLHYFVSIPFFCFATLGSTVVDGRSETIDTPCVVCKCFASQLVSSHSFWDWRQHVQHEDVRAGGCFVLYELEYFVLVQSTS